ncbi:MAG: AlbA family DNA-binding domain-containing protein [Mycobacterium sp.]
MSLNIDTTEAFHSPQRLTALAEAVFRADISTSETHWLEWKSALDFDTTAGRFAAARTIIAFANRDPQTAVRECGGEAYLLVGVEPGQAAGVAVLDAAVLHDKLKPFVDGPHWEMTYVEVDSTSVAVFTVAAPQPGDRIHSLVSAYQGNRSGTVFHRGVASSAPATHRELNMLQDRLLQSAPESTADQFRAAVGGTNPLLVERLMRGAVKKVTTARADPEQFPASFTTHDRIEHLKQYLVIAHRYHDIAAPVLEHFITGCAWPNPAHDRIWTEAITALAQPARLRETVTGRLRTAGTEALVMAGRDSRLEALAILPATLALYAGAIASLAGRNFSALRALTTDGVVSRSITHPQLKVTVIEKAGPWEALDRDDSYALTLRAAQVAPDAAGLDEKLTLIAQGRLRKPRFACSSYLSEALRPHFDDYDPTRYAELFDEAEIMFSLIVADQMPHHNVYAEPWLGLFVDDAANTARLQDSHFGAVLADVHAAREQWAPLQAGLFGGSFQRLQAAAQRVTQYTEQMRHRGPY